MKFLLNLVSYLIIFLFQVVKDAGYNYVKGMKKGEADIKRQRSLVVMDSFYPSEPSQSPQSSASAG